ncbi:MAG: ankyrin repeat domain-containing protein [Gammaproteobacteria bacterium]|nr:ankyrin repeat domain-containing protein [Gammaproteobacteria bacterium]
MAGSRQTEALEAAAKGEHSRVKGLLLAEHAQSRAGVGLGSDSDLTALQLASLHDDEVARALLAGGASCDLHSACALGLADEIGRMAPAGDLGALAENLTPMGFALVKNQLVAVRALLRAGDDPSRPLPRIGFFVWEIEALAAGFGNWSPLQAACTHGYAGDAAAIISVLLEAGADRDAPSPLGDRPIHLAAVYGWMPVLETLLAAGADVDSRTVSVEDVIWRMSSPAHAERVTDSTPTMVAAREGGVETVRWLLARGADVNARDSAGATPLHAAARPWWGEKPETVSVLLASGADRRTRDATGRTPQDVAAVAGFAATARLLGEGH